MKNIQSQRFNRLIAEYPIGKNKKGTIWHCKCDCGKSIDVPIVHLTQGWRGSCGCLLGGPPNKDLTGMIFGRLKVISYEGRFPTKQDKNHKTFAGWKCQCSCGRTVIKTARALLHDKTKSCGCILKENLSTKKQINLKPNTFLERYYKIYKYQAKHKNHIWDLSFSQFELLVNANCYLCGAEPEPKSLCRSKKYKVYSNFNGIDRLDSNEGYTPTNCKPCCSVCNIMKTDMSLIKFVSHIKKIYQHII